MSKKVRVLALKQTGPLPNSDQLSFQTPNADDTAPGKEFVQVSSLIKYLDVVEFAGNMIVSLASGSGEIPQERHQNAVRLYYNNATCSFPNNIPMGIY